MKSRFALGAIAMSAMFVLCRPSVAAVSSVGAPADEFALATEIRVTLDDTFQMKFSEKPVVKAGNIINFVVTNRGRIRHEFFIGDKAEQLKHKRKIRALRGTAENAQTSFSNAILLAPGQTKSLKWRFDNPGKVVIFACNMPGHYEAGEYYITVVEE
ncbi:hypothetical protein CS022_03190 [Veronia nyctiphanis]|uniref:Blue (type 1) copper domain-containing protein n=1 Tax=Veronia nyctiphanis TaxID=1278244 RepID=A0A4V1LTB2_9GAMM|nr:hypothetical protein [Veronia nyctiphanis]RXJ74588.1 hypothetical protein CS022_03190 [Veronia nyctiphanis]